MIKDKPIKFMTKKGILENKCCVCGIESATSICSLCLIASQKEEASFLIEIKSITEIQDD